MKKSTRYSAAQKSALIAAQASRGLSKKAFCEKQGIKYTVFKNWFYRKEKSPLSSKVLQFCKLTSKPPSSPIKEIKTSTIHLRLTNGTEFDFPTDLTAAQWQAILTVLGVTLC